MQASNELYKMRDRAFQQAATVKCQNRILSDYKQLGSLLFQSHWTPPLTQSGFPPSKPVVSQLCFQPRHSRRTLCGGGGRVDRGRFDRLLYFTTTRHQSSLSDTERILSSRALTFAIATSQVLVCTRGSCTVLTLSKMKGLPRYDLHSLAILFLIGLRVMSFNSSDAEELSDITTAQQLLALKESELKTFVAAVEANARNCDVLDGCSIANCSRLTCYQYGTLDNSNYQCLPVTNYTVCDYLNEAGNSTCTERNFDFTKSFISINDSSSSHTVARTVCTHRSLEDQFKSSTMSNPKYFFRAFLGTVDGTLRSYPGTDEPCPDTYDPRIRPWYIESTHIPKIVTVLIDTGLFMRGYVTASKDEKYIGKAIATGLALLGTLKEKTDYVNFVCFDGNGMTLINRSSTAYDDSMYSFFNEALTAVANDSTVTSDPSLAETKDAIDSAISQLSTAEPTNYLKVVIVLLSGINYIDISELNVSVVPYMNLFMYSFQTALNPQCNLNIRASLEEIPDERLDNPLFALLSYFSFMAKLHSASKGNHSDFGLIYPDFSGIDANTLTISKAAFGPSGELLGVVGIDFFGNRIQQQFPTITFQDIEQEARKEDPALQNYNYTVNLAANVCFNYTDACPNINATINSGGLQGYLCGMTNEGDENEKIGCCGACKAAIPTPTHKKTHAWPKIVAGATGGAVLIVLLLLACVKGVPYLLRVRYDRRKASNTPAYPGSDGDAGSD